MNLKCLFKGHRYKSEGIGKENKIVCFCRNCFKIITVEQEDKKDCYTCKKMLHCDESIGSVSGEGKYTCLSWIKK